MLGSSGMLLTALIVLWRKGVPAYINAYKWQAWLLAVLTAIVGYFGGGPRAFQGAAPLGVVQRLAIPALPRAMARRGLGHPPTPPHTHTPPHRPPPRPPP